MSRRTKEEQPVPASKAKSARAQRSRITVLLVDPNPIARDGMSCILGQHADVRVVAAVGDTIEAVREAERVKPHVAVMDISMPGLNGIDATRLMTGKASGLGVVILSTHSSPVVVRRAV